MLGAPGFILGLGLGVTVRRWSSLALVGGVAAVAFWRTAQHFGSGSGDNDPGVIVVVALVANLVTLLLGMLAGELATRFSPGD